MSGNLELEDLTESVLVPLSKDPEVQAVVEVFPIPTGGKMNMDLRVITVTIHKLFPKAHHIGPGVWKQNQLVVNIKTPNEWEDRVLTLHQKDAYRIALWYLFTQKEVPSEN
jgi:hypothetical protein